MNRTTFSEHQVTIFAWQESVGVAELRAEARHRKPDVILTHCSAGLGWPSFVTPTFVTGLGLRSGAPPFVSSSLPGASAWDVGLEDEEWERNRGNLGMEPSASATHPVS